MTHRTPKSSYITSDNNNQFTPFSVRFRSRNLFLVGSLFLLEPQNNELKFTTRTRIKRDDEDENLRSNNGVVCNGHGGGSGYDEIVGTVLVEKECAPMR
ncbi:uncharacterized protein DS421_17g595540 [Arachis hypogaea]|nr:uncharacterized protein DS421_17g595540 [Arachis hypogaea]